MLNCLYYKLNKNNVFIYKQTVLFLIKINLYLYLDTYYFYEMFFTLYL